MKKFHEFVMLKENAPTPQEIEVVRNELNSLRPIGGMVNPEQWKAKLTHLSQQFPWLNAQQGPSASVHGFSLPQGSEVQKMIVLLSDPQANFSNYQAGLEALKMLHHGLQGQLSNMAAKLKPSTGGTPDFYKYQ